MKAAVYDALSNLNRGFDSALESLKLLQEEGIITAEYVQRETEIVEELRSGINALVLNKLEDREKDDRDHFGKMKIATEARLKE